MDLQLLGTAAAFGLAAAAGLNTTIPLLIVGLLARAGLLGLTPPFDALAGNVALSGLALLAVLELVGDKVPGLDSVVQAIQLPLAAAAGAILFASQTSTISWVAPELAILVGLLTSSAVHTLRMSFRPAVTGLTAGLGNGAVSLAEDFFSFLLTTLALFAPLLGLLLLVFGGLLLFAVARRGFTWGARRFAALRQHG
jgi:hypothetical protein